MGRMNALGMKESVDEGLINLDSALLWHLRSNHYPPIPSAMVEPAKEAINLANMGEWDTEISLPEGITWHGQEVSPVSAIIEGLHLDSFLEDQGE
jgi:hypothetical protein